MGERDRSSLFTEVDLRTGTAYCNRDSRTCPVSIWYILTESYGRGVGGWGIEGGLDKGRIAMENDLNKARVRVGNGLSKRRVG